MAAVDIFDVKVLDNPAPFTNPLQFEITYDVREALKEGESHSGNLKLLLRKLYAELCGF
jgi:hypothetical protein